MTVVDVVHDRPELDPLGSGGKIRKVQPRFDVIAGVVADEEPVETDLLCAEAGRDPGSLLKSHFTSWLMVSESDAGANAKLDHYFPNGLTEEQSRTRIHGSPETVTAYFKALIEIGFEYFVVQIQDSRDLETIRLLGTEVAPAVR